MLAGVGITRTLNAASNSACSAIITWAVLSKQLMLSRRKVACSFVMDIACFFVNSVESVYRR
jgi:hypothetical protein